MLPGVAPAMVLASAIKITPPGSSTSARIMSAIVPRVMRS
jgi:hypothetical protein